MSASWWDNPLAIRALTTWTTGLLGERRRRVEMDRTLPYPGVTNGEAVTLQPSWAQDAYQEYCVLAQKHGLPILSETQFTWAAVKGVAAHEVGHSRFSGTYPLSRALRRLVNILDDSRVERGMIRLWPGLAPHIRLARLASWIQAPVVHDATGAALLWRFESEFPQALGTKIALQGEEARRWEQARPLVEQAWDAPTPEELESLARRILDILGEPESQGPTQQAHDFQDRPEGDQPDPLPQPAGENKQSGGKSQAGQNSKDETGAQGSAQGQPQGKDQEEGSPQDAAGENAGGEESTGTQGSDAGLSGGSSDQDPEQSSEAQASAGRSNQERDALADALEGLLQEVIPDGISIRHKGDGHSETKRDGRIVPLPRLKATTLMAQARPLAARLVPVLRRPQRAAWERVEMGERFSARDYVRTPRTPFLSEYQDERCDIELEVWCDASGSMGFDNPKINNARLGVAALLLACEQLDVPTALAFFWGDNGPEWQVAKESNEPLTTTVQEYLAGWAGAGSDYLLSLMEAREAGLWDRRRSGRKPMVVIVHDGYPASDRDEIKAWVRRNRQRGLAVIGMYLGTEDDEAEKMRDIFPDVIVCQPERFPQQLGLLLRRLLQR